ncbi:MAG: heavy metal translocating P-type ATPase [Phycisphaerales bacterium JB043]
MSTDDISARSLLRNIVSDEWQMPLALACGTALLIGFSLQQLTLDSWQPDSPAQWSDSFIAAGKTLVWVSLALGAVHGLRAAWESISQFEPNIDVLMVVGAGLAAWIGHPAEGALLLFMFTLAGALEHRALTKARDAVSRLSKLMPDEALRQASTDDGSAWETVSPSDLTPGDRILVKPGQTIPTDAIVVTGRSTIDQSTLTGESIPRPVEPGESVYAGTLNQNGALELDVTRPIQESSLQKILDLVIEAQEQRQPLQRVIDTFSTPYTLSVFALAIIVFIVLAIQLPTQDAAYRSITLLIVASPCALVIATPTATLCGLNRAARGGLLVKGGDALERLANVRSVALDKTGTLTTGKLEVIATDITDDDSEVDLLPVVRAIEERSTHPIAQAIVRYAKKHSAHPCDIQNVQMVPGKGIDADCQNMHASIGSFGYIEPKLVESMRTRITPVINDAKERGSVVAAFSWGDKAMVFELADTPRPGAQSLVSQLREAGVTHVAMLTGDHQRIASKLARDLDLDEVHADLLPEQKVEHMQRIKREHPGRLAVIGDGVNDAPALASADVGLAMGAIGADAALETADVVVLRDTLDSVPWAFRLARQARTVMLQNLIFAMSIIAVLAVCSVLGIIPMGVGVIGHEGSTLLVVANSLQLLAFRAPSQA